MFALAAAQIAAVYSSRSRKLPRRDAESGKLFQYPFYELNGITQKWIHGQEIKVVANGGMSPRIKAGSISMALVRLSLATQLISGI